MGVAKSTEKAAVTQISQRSVEAIFRVGDLFNEREVAYRQGNNEITFSAGETRLSFQRNVDKTLATKPEKSNMVDPKNEQEKYLMDCILSLVAQLSKDRSKLPEEINRRISGAKTLPIDMLWMTRTYLVPYEGQQTFVEYSQAPKADKGNFSISGAKGALMQGVLVIPFKLINDPPSDSLKPNAFLFVPEPVYPVSFKYSETSGLTKSGYIAMGSVLSLAKFVAMPQKLKVIVPHYLDDAAKARFAHLGLEEMAATIRR